MEELAKAYEPQKYEDKIYKNWEDSGFFNPDNLEGEVYTIMMPPPNVTGILHLGHALENTLMDTMARYQRMQGKKVLLLPGTDHAAVATQSRVEKNLLEEEGIENPRELYGREKLLEIIRNYAEQSKTTILKQIKKMGTSANWDRLAYTFDEKRSLAVRTVFKKMYDDGLIYQGYRVINWSVKGQSTCSDDELIHIDRPAKMYYFKYSKDFPLTIATTRPETKLGDTAVAVHPEGKFKKFIGQEFEIKNFADGPDLQIKIIGSEDVDEELGTGALGVTPAHSGVDFEMYEKQKANSDEIAIIQVIGEDGKMTKEAGKEYQELSVLEAREKVVANLKKQGLFEKEEEITQTVGTSDRFGDVVEAIPMKQWWLDVNKKIIGKGKSLRDLMKDALTAGLDGDEAKKVVINPERFTKLYLDRVDNLRDWCLSRQIWWGHQIPVWYKGKEVYCGVDAPDGIGWTQDEDTLDTWFSSGLWTFSTLGWPEQTKDLKDFHPTNWMQMGHEILYLWLMRMVLMTTYNLGEIPFKDVYIHGMLRDKNGDKFSKSAKNGIDPLDVIKEYGTDALRFSLISGVTPGNDSRFYMEKVEGAQHLVNKLWNMVRFMLMNIPEPKKDIKKPEGNTLADKWILNSINTSIRSINDSLESCQFSVAGELLRSFTWDQLADDYLEYAKIEGSKSEILNYILNTILKLWHPFMPFVTEAIWKEIYGEDEMLMVENWPEYKIENYVFDDYDLIKDIIIKIRSIRSENGIEPGKKIDIKISAGDKLDLIKQNSEIIKRHWTNVENLEIAEKIEKPDGWFEFPEKGVNVFVDLSGAIDKDKLKKEAENLEKYITSVEKKLGNSAFADNAPKEVVEGEQKKMDEAKSKLVKIQEQI